MENSRHTQTDAVTIDTVDDWMGFKRHSFLFRQKAACVVVPEHPLPGNPWIWRARFFGAFPPVDIELVRRGFHLAHVDVANLYGAPRLLFPLWDAFYDYLLQDWHLAERMVLEGFSRGGLPIYNWANQYPQRVACLYADAPVCDIRSWPAGKGRGNGSPDDWARCLDAYQIGEEDVDAFEENPFALLALIVKAEIPIIHVCGDADDGVPIEENTLLLKARLEELGGAMTLIVKEGVGHHPHSLDPPDDIVEFIMRHAAS